MPARIVIVGGGFAGAVTAVHLLRAAHAPVEIAVIEPRATLGAGLAYGTTDPAHRINVPSDKMVVLPGRPRAFTDWLERTGRRAADPAGEDGTGQHYSRRADFGAFMSDLLTETAARAAPGCTVVHLRDRAVRVTPRASGVGVSLASGEVCGADKVVLAMSHDRPAPPVTPGPGVVVHPGFLADPWEPSRLGRIHRDADVVVLGTGLTMVDVVAGLLSRGHRGPILAASRRGLLPQGHAAFDPVRPLSADRRPATAREGLGLARALVAEERAAGRDWQLAIECLRRAASDIWQGWPVSEQRRALRRLRPVWDVHRFRIAPQLAAAIAKAQEDGRLTLCRAGCAGLSVSGGRLAVDLDARGKRQDRVIADAVVLCTGPGGDVTRREDLLLRALFDEGAARPDPHRMGLDVDAALRVRDAEGASQDALHAVGPLTRGVTWEVVGVPELSAQANSLAMTLVADLAPCTGMAQRA